MAIGIFDSGLGGLTVYDAIRKQMPDLNIVYLGDHKHAPYGVRGVDDIFRCTTQSVQILFDHGCDLVILACNTASAAALRRMQEHWLSGDKRVLGVFVPMIEALTERHWGDNSPPRQVAVEHVALLRRPQLCRAGPFSANWRFAPSVWMWKRRPVAAWWMLLKMGISFLPKLWCKAMWTRCTAKCHIRKPPFWDAPIIL